MATAVQAPNIAGVSKSPNLDTRPVSREDARRRERLKLHLPLQVRPFDARFIEIEDIGEVQDFTRDGLFFVTRMPHYLVGMRVIVTFPFGEIASAHHRFLGSIVRLEDRKDGTRGIAVRFLV
jgi:PilZ domain-containing protein